MNKINALIELGGKEWIKDDHHRIYFNRAATAELIGFEVTRYKTGNIRSAKLNGSEISNRRARGVDSDLSFGKFWYDVKTDMYMQKGMSAEVASLIKEKIIEKVGE